MRIYVAGPITNRDPKVQWDNIKRGCEVGMELIKKGYSAFIPHLYGYLNFDLPDCIDKESWLEKDFDFLRVCDAFFYMGSSPGADRELKEAENLGIPIYKRLEDVPDLNHECRKEKSIRVL